ncbi:DUF3870 domain-containing protein [Fusobacterium sp. PH5-44]|uniref:DUF3870 domain-containing protein n=1 Tax=unclassified Fusobacterium TaxID=2648384 RepID=UPI003D246C6B
MDKIYIVGNAKTSLTNPITKIYNKFFIAFVVSYDNDIILDVEIPAVLEVTNQFIKEIFVGKHFIKSQNEIIDRINTRYIGESQKSLIVAYKDALKKYISLKN